MVKFNIFLLFLMFSLSIFFPSNLIFAQDAAPKPESFIPICIPAGCPGEYIPDFNCITKQAINPQAKIRGNPEYCCENQCKNEDTGLTQPTTQRAEEYEALFSFFGNRIYISVLDRIPTLINLGITTFLGAISLYTIVYGIFLAGFKRTQTIDSGEIEKISKTLISLVAGFVLIWSFIAIMQVVASFLGLGSLNNLILVGGDPQSEIIIR